MRLNNPSDLENQDLFQQTKYMSLSSFVKEPSGTFQLRLANRGSPYAQAYLRPMIFPGWICSKLDVSLVMLSEVTLTHDV